MENLDMFKTLPRIENGVVVNRKSEQMNKVRASLRKIREEEGEEAFEKACARNVMITLGIWEGKVE